MPAQETREETPEPEMEDLPGQPAGLVSSSRAQWDVEDQLEALGRLKADLDSLASDDSREHFPKFPELHDLTWLTLHTKTKRAISAAERFLQKVNSSGRLREQVSLLGQGNRHDVSRQTRDVKLACEYVTRLLEEAVGLQSQILAGQHRKPAGEGRLQRPLFAPSVFRPARSQLPKPRTDYHGRTQALIDPDYVPRKRVAGFGEENVESERYRVVLRPDVGTLEEERAFRGRGGEAPLLVLAEHVPLTDVKRKQKEGEHQEWIPPIVSLVPMTEEIEDGRRNGHPAVRGPDPEGHGHTDESTSTDEVRPSDTYPTTNPKSLTLQKLRSYQDWDQKPTIRTVFSNDDFMKTSFADQVQSQRPRPSAKRRFDTYTEEEGRRAVHPHLSKAMAASDHRVAVLHDRVRGAVHVCEYFRAHNRPYLAQTHWVGGPEGTGAEAVAAEGERAWVDGDGDWVIPEGR
ncbi:hypothetical protein F4781DRAFT_439536 [Annulohypoxylon bovei var. microspora]|nr:hypothetical protein F4781DRAFT_439536 [Annulohypoxylon bovei var. microspora]